MIQVYFVARLTWYLSIVGLLVSVTLCRIIFSPRCGSAGLSLFYYKFQFVGLVESLHRPLPLPLGEVPKAERAVGVRIVMGIMEAW